MAAPAQFQLFPPPSPKNKPQVNPFRKAGKRQPTKPQAVSPIVNELKYSGQTEAVIVQIIEDTSVLAPPKARTIDTKLVELSPRVEEHNSIKSSPIAQSFKPGSASLVQINARGAQPKSPQSPVIAMRSMFPRFDPNLPLKEQQYQPHRTGSTHLPRKAVSREEYSPSVSSPSNRDNALGGPKSVPASVLNFPSDAMAPPPAQFSSAEELERLWDATNGQDSHAFLGLFNLRMGK
jgi:hypothetical protein